MPAVLRHELLQHADVGVEVLEHAEREAGPDQPVDQLVAARDAQAPVVQKSTAPARGDIQVVAGRIEDHAMGEHALVQPCAIDTQYCGKPCR